MSHFVGRRVVTQIRKLLEHHADTLLAELRTKSQQLDSLQVRLGCLSWECRLMHCYVTH
jgi:hypothetical protein